MNGIKASSFDSEVSKVFYIKISKLNYSYEKIYKERTMSMTLLKYWNKMTSRRRTHASNYVIMASIFLTEHDASYFEKISSVLTFL